VHWKPKVMTIKHSNVLIIGGGFAATKCAKTLRKKLSRDSCHIVLFSRENHMGFTLSWRML